MEKSSSDEWNLNVKLRKITSYNSKNKQTRKKKRQYPGIIDWEASVVR